jgi:hypothetical protein
MESMGDNLFVISAFKYKKPSLPILTTGKLGFKISVSLLTNSLDYFSNIFIRCMMLTEDLFWVLVCR